MNPEYEIKFLFSLLLTLVMEIPCLVLCLKLMQKRDTNKIPLHLILLAGFLATFATLPYVWFVIPAFIHKYIYYTITAELFAFIFEGLIYTFFLKQPIHRGMILSFICNGLSFLGGEVMKVIL